MVPQGWSQYEEATESNIDQLHGSALRNLSDGVCSRRCSDHQSQGCKNNSSEIAFRDSQIVIMQTTEVRVETRDRTEDEIIKDHRSSHVVSNTRFGLSFM